MIVAVLGASDNPERYSNKAVKLLTEYGHRVIPVNPAHARIEGLEAVPDLKSVPPGEVDTVTVYLNPGRSDVFRDDLLRLKPRRVIFNPGAENPALADYLNQHGIETEDACTLVLLRTGAF